MCELIKFHFKLKISFIYLTVNNSKYQLNFHQNTNMSRGSRVTTILAILAVLWTIAFIFTKGGSSLHFVVRALPSYSLIVLGCYGLFEIGKGIMILKDYPQEYSSLLKDIDRARASLKTKAT